VEHDPHGGPPDDLDDLDDLDAVERHAADLAHTDDAGPCDDRVPDLDLEAGADGHDAPGGPVVDDDEPRPSRGDADRAAELEALVAELEELEADLDALAAEVATVDAARDQR
jgi:hypothetical protein